MTQTVAQRVLADTPLPLNATRLAALCDLAAIRVGTRIRHGIELVLLDGVSINGAAQHLGIKPASVHAAANRIAITQALIRKATT